jgi:hypothetical protein
MLEKKLEYNAAVHQLLTDFKKAYDSVRGDVLYNKQKYLNKTYSRVRIGNYLSDMLPIGNGFKKETLHRHGFSTLL